MNEFALYMQTVKDRLGLKSDRQLAKALRMSQPHVSDVMRGLSNPSDDFAVRVAELVGDSPEKAMLLAHKSKASEKSRPHWDKIIKALASVALAIILLAGPALASVQVEKIYYVKYSADENWPL